MKRAATLGLVVISTAAFGAERQADLTSFAVISDEVGHSRCLFRADEAASLGTVAIMSAELVVPLSGSASDRTLRLAVYPVTRDWSADAVSWVSGWARPGGDFDPEVVGLAEVDLADGSAVARFDVTPHLKQWLEQSEAYHGFLLSVQPEFGEGMSSDDANRLQSLGGAELTVVYRQVEPAPVDRAAAD